MTLATIAGLKTKAGGALTHMERHGKKAGWLAGLEHRLEDLIFQVGLSGPSRFSYKDSRALTAKEKVLLDEEVMRFV